jgi:hypothetical protein
MNEALGDVISVSLLLLTFGMTAIYVLTNPAESQIFKLLYIGLLGITVLLTIVLVGLVMREADFGTH